MEPVEAEGNSIDEAIENALNMLGVSRDRVEIEIVSNSARGLFGIGGHKARVRAVLRAPVDVDAPEPEIPKTSPEPPQTPPTSKTVEHAVQTLQEIVKLMEVPAAVNAREEDEQVVLELTGDSSGILIGRRGQMLDALEYLLNRVVAREGESGRIVVDSQNYRARRRQSLEELARRMGEQAKRKRKAIALNPMSPRDRRIVHLALQEDPALSTRSSGKGYFRKLIIIPAGAASAGQKGQQPPTARDS
ncbi:MAG: RNA-binding cell elongation regulator Jag/EloR [Candidatus Binatia bacterium]|jgi:spoIIIJ-associated protein